MGEYIVIEPTNVQPVAPGPVYGEGAEFNVDERKPELALWVAEQRKVGVIAPVAAKAEPKVKTAEEIEAAEVKKAKAKAAREAKAKKDADAKAKKAKAAADAKAEKKAKEETPKPNEDEGE